MSGILFCTYSYDQTPVELMQIHPEPLDIRALKNTNLLSSLTCHRNYQIFATKALGLIILLAPLMLAAQSQTYSGRTTDSLMKIIHTSGGTKKVDALNNAADNALKFSAKDAMSFAKPAYELAGELQYTKGTAKALFNLAAAYGHLGETKQAIDADNQAMEIFRKIHEWESVYLCLIRLANNYAYLDNNDKVVETYLQSFHLAMEMGRNDLQAQSSAYLSQFFVKMNDKPKALNYASKAILLSEIAQISRISGLAYLSMANYMSRYGLQQNTTTNYYHKALKNFKSDKQSSFIAGCYVQLGNHYLGLGAMDSAKACFFRALKINIAAHDIMPEAAVYAYLSHTFQLEHQYEKALLFQRKALSLRQSYGNLWLTGSSLSNIGTIYSEMGNYPKALFYFRSGLAIAKQTGRSENIKFNYHHIYMLYIASKDYKKAFEYNVLLTAIDDTILKNRASKKFAEINYKHEVGKKIQAIAFLSKENELQKLKLKQTNFTTYILFALIILFLIIALLLIIQNKLKARHRKMDIEQKLLRSQMNPHFIFNALVAIQSFIYKKESAEAAKYLSSFARLIRLVLANSSQEFVTLKCEIDTLSYYLSLQKLRFENKFEYTIEVDPAIDTELIHVPPMLAQPFVENAIEHGIFALEKPGRIVISVRQKVNTIVLEVLDNGVGRVKGREMRKKTDKSHESLATRITEERISSLNRKYPWRISLRITDLYNSSKEPTGTNVSLSIPSNITSSN